MIYEPISLKNHTATLQGYSDSKKEVQIKFESIAQGGAAVKITIAEESIVVPCELLLKVAKLFHSEKRDIFMALQR